MLEAALQFADAGLHVLPIYGTDEAGVCSCPAGAGCKSPGKHPLTTNGLTAATTDAARIRGWWRAWPRANIGIATGPSGLVVVDVDGKDGRAGPENWRRLVEELGPELEDTTIVDTASGSGFHVYFRAGEHKVKSFSGALGEAIDVKAQGGYVIAPASIIAGRDYAFRDGQGLNRLNPLTPALAARLAVVKEPESSHGGASSPVLREGERNAGLTSMAGSMRRRDFGEKAIAAALLVTNAEQCDPLLPDHEVLGIARSMMRYDATASVAPAGDGDVGDRPRRLAPISMAELSRQEPEMAAGVIAGYVFPNCITDLASPPKTGKTTFLLAAARAVCRGDIFLLGETCQGPVVYLSEENKATFVAAARRVGADGEIDLYPIFRREAFGMTWPEICDEVAHCCLELGAVLVIVDTLSDWAGIRGDDENSAGAALEAIEPLRALAQQPGLAVIVARHERKSGGEVGEAARGSSQFTGAVDVVVSLRRVGAEARTRRSLKALSRFDETPEELVIEFSEGTFESRGAAKGLRQKDQDEKVLSVLRPGREQALGLAELTAQLSPLSEATVRRILGRLVDKCLVCEAKGAAPGQHGTAHGYWLCELDAAP